MQSVLDPHGPLAAQIAAITWVLIIGGAAIFLAVMGVAAYAVFAPRNRAWMARTDFIIGAGIIFPVAVLSALLTYTLLKISGKQDEQQPAVRIEVIGEQWWWRVHYLDAAGNRQFATANELYIPVGRPVELALLSADVIHSFWVPNLAGKLDMIPGRVNRLRLSADRLGVVRGQCAEYCGGPHAQMAFYVIAASPAEFERWLANERQEAAAPANEFLARGRSLFLAGGCGACHSVRGTPAAGARGPDLTHVGSRRSIAAGTLPNNAGTLAAWIASSQHLKPQNAMPSFTVFSGEELRALAAYLESLK